MSSNVISLSREAAKRATEKPSREVRLERLRKTLIGLIEEHADLPRSDLLSEFTGCVVVIEAGVYGWRR